MGFLASPGPKDIQQIRYFVSLKSLRLAAIRMFFLSSTRKAKVAVDTLSMKYLFHQRNYEIESSWAVVIALKPTLHPNADANDSLTVDATHVL
jgi:hypothetical protein